ncbi:hypothetical protein HanRHA438_Chr11g0502121 [Helianthus annuus]|uniref:Uncharacterized protein n=1 Tax=Helianthus annuus TaxID=4232 RepID=A0A9K3HPA6_HELAN|nr:hypothetical protein HanXRQr2_Chr11g0489341 [Helianthus annuus]KAJ0870585.1 hypothetical protein HanRHA438_Chr11g0502121 [Helianthus annuus]KAJ0875049.1 hypothetical protein HanPSC8_Chr11g0471621 [Helianthus annuus]
MRVRPAASVVDLYKTVLVSVNAHVLGSNGSCLTGLGQTGHFKKQVKLVWVKTGHV